MRKEPIRHSRRAFGLAAVLLALAAAAAVPAFAAVSYTHLRAHET